MRKTKIHEREYEPDSNEESDAFTEDEHRDYSDDKRENHSDNGDSIDNLNNSSSSLGFKIIFVFTIVGLLILAAWLLHRDSRPEVVDSLFSPMDENLELQQDWVDSYVNLLMKYAGVKVNRFNKRTLKQNKKENSAIDWTTINNENRMASFKLKAALDEKKKELEALKKRRKELISEIGPIKILNDEIKVKIEKIKEMGNEFITNFELKFTKIYKTIYNLAVLKAFRIDLEKRMKIVMRVKSRLEERRGICVYQKPINIFLKLRGICTNRLRKIVGEGRNEIPIPDDLYKDLINIIKEESEVKPIEVADDNYEILNEPEKVLLHNCQIIELRLVELLDSDYAFYENMKEKFNQLRIYEDFIKEFRNPVDLKNIKTHLEKQTDRIDRLSKFFNESKNYSKIVNDNWHKRMCTILFTKTELIYYERMKFIESETKRDYLNNLSNWYEKKLKVNFSSDKEINRYLFQVLSDRSVDVKSSFNLERSIQFFSNINSKLPEPSQNLDDIIEYYRVLGSSIFADFVIFHISSFCGMLLRIDPPILKGINSESIYPFNILRLEFRRDLEDIKKNLLK